MSRHRRLVASLILLAMVLLTVGAAAAKERTNIQSGAAPRITWSARKIEQSLAPGHSATVMVSFTSSTDLQDVTLNVPGKLAQVVKVSPASFAAVSANTATQVTVTVSVPAGWKGNADGVVQVRAGKRVVAEPLHVQVKVPKTAKPAHEKKSDAKSSDAEKATEHKQSKDDKKAGKH